MRFDITRRCPRSAARRGRLTVRGHGFDTPVFMPVGTAATVKGVRPDEVAAAGTRILLCNTYHLHLRPGEEVIAALGGLHRFMGWEGAVLTDSGGYQVFSLASRVRVDDEGVTFRSHLDGTTVALGPEEAVRIQARLGSDIVMVLDQCVPYPCPRPEAAAAVERSARWAERGLAAHRALDTGAALFGIVQGSTFPGLRALSARLTTALPFEGFALGGLSVGEGKRLMREMIACTAPLLPEDRPRYLMGVGEVDDILDAVAMGIDLFDCVLPTRNARNGTLFTRRGVLKLRNAALKRDPAPPDPECGCPLCTRFSRAYLRHLFNAREMLGPVLATLHNLRFYQDLMEGIRNALAEGTFPEFREAFLERYRGGEPAE